MKVLILGHTGMLGHRLVSALRIMGHDVYGAIRRQDIPEALRGLRRWPICGVDATRPKTIEAVLDRTEPEAVVNCIGIVKQLEAAKDPETCISINALFPHQLARLCADRGVRMVHFSTDCVFSGTHGPYSEASLPDPNDLYGRSKLLGEVNQPNAITLRTSVIGHELGDGVGLVSWILRNRGCRVSGYARALYSGVTTDFMASAVSRILRDHPDLHGVWHLSSDPISKFELVELINEIYDLDMEVDRDETFVCDRRLDSQPLRSRTGIVPPDWPTMLREMYSSYLVEERGYPPAAAKRVSPESASLASVAGAAS